MAIKMISQYFRIVKMFYTFYILILIQMCRSKDPVQDWQYINIHCRDNDNKPVEWWYIYKPSVGNAPHLDVGSNFSYITPEFVRWEASDRLITSNSMLQLTLSPLFRSTDANLALIAYSDREDKLYSGTDAHGLMMADEEGGVWMGYTVPGLLNFTANLLSFPAAELEKGHLLMCFSLDLPTLNTVALSIKSTVPKVLRMKVPQRIRKHLPNWQFFNNRPMRVNKGLPVKPIAFETLGKTLRAIMLVRRPGERQCLYRAFAQANKIVMDAYGHDVLGYNYCENSFGIRRIESISLKYLHNVYYIDNRSDSTSFAISTAAHWQKKGDGGSKFWVCTGGVEKEDTKFKGGLVVCVESYNVWWTFDNMKIKEPKC